MNISREVEIGRFYKVIETPFPADGMKGEKQYEDCISRREIWDNLSSVTHEQVRDIIIGFLNDWQCRLSESCSQELTSALHEAEKYLKPLRRYNLEDIDFVNEMNLSEKSSVTQIKKTYNIICNVKAGKRTVGPTATSKILHMAIPSLFVMNDAGIRKNYGCSDNSEGYINFMMRMNLIAKNLISQAKDKEAILERSFLKERTLPRLLDSYNYTIMREKKKTDL